MKPKYNVLQAICFYKNGSNKKENMLKIIKCMEPIIKKYSKNLYWEHEEDIRQELVIAIIEAVNKIEKYDNEGEIISFLANAVRNRFLELYRKNKNLYEEDIMEKEIVDKQYINKFEDIEFKADLKLVMKCSTFIQKNIAYLILHEGMTDSEISNHLGVSRQYVNRCKKIIFKNLVNYSFTNIEK